METQNNFSFKPFYVTFPEKYFQNDIFELYFHDPEEVPTTFEITARIEKSKKAFGNKGPILPYRKVTIYLKAKSMEGKNYLQEGWPVLLPGLGNKWFFVGKNNSITINYPLNKRVEDLTLALPLNQFDRSFTNEELCKLNAGNLEKNIERLKFLAYDKCTPF